jgi:hypothetical protein
MEARGRRGGRPSLPGVHRLVALLVEDAGLPPDVWGKRDFTDRGKDGFGKVRVRLNLQELRIPLFHHEADRAVFKRHEDFTGPDPLRPVARRKPQPAADLPHEKYFDGPSRCP